MSLREEIYNTVKSSSMHYNDNLINLLVNEIISKIEKRIDKMVNIAYERDPTSVWALIQVKEMLQK